MTNTGRLNPEPEPTGSGNEAHQTSPRFTAKNLELGFHDGGLNPFCLLSIDSIELLRDSRVVPLTEIFGMAMGVNVGTSNRRIMR